MQSEVNLKKQKIVDLVEQLREVILYNRTMGVITSKKTGKPYLSKDNHGYICFHALGKKWKVHRVIWFMERGTWPDIVDHIDGDRTNNKISNLREADYKQNSYNCEVKSTASNYKGVWRAKSGKWRASLTNNGKRIHLGYFNTAEEAAEVYNREIVKYDPNGDYGSRSKEALDKINEIMDTK